MDVPQILHSFSRLRVLVIGDVMMDSYIRGKVERISPEAPVPVVKVQKSYFRLGGAGNVALNIRALGAEVSLCSAVGEDANGEKLLRELSRAGVGAEGILVSSARPTTVKTRILTSHQHVVRVDEETDEEISREECKQLLEHIKKRMGNCDVVLFEDYDKGVISQTLIEEVMRLTQPRNIPTVVDPKKRNFLFYKNATLFKPNLKELCEGLKIDLQGADFEELSKAAEQLMREMNVKNVMVTLSEHGVFFQTPDEKKILPAHPREIADVSGAGDTVISIAALCTALKLPMETTAALANLGGGLVCQHTGVIPVDAGELAKEAALIGI